MASAKQTKGRSADGAKIRARKLKPAKAGGKKGARAQAAGAPASKKPGRPGDKVIEADFAAGAVTADQFPPPAIAELAFAGRSNVGKSSLMNSIMQRKGLVRTSGTPGCTRQVSWFRTVSDDGAQIDLVDLPGYGYAKRSKTERNAWATLIESYLLERPTLRGVLVLIDVRRGFEQDDAQLIELLQGQARVSRNALELTVVATKLDKLPRNQHRPTLERLSEQAGVRVIGHSAVDGTGRLGLWRRLRRIAGVSLDTQPDVG